MHRITASRNGRIALFRSYQSGLLSLNHFALTFTIALSTLCLLSSCTKPGVINDVSNEPNIDTAENSYDEEEPTPAQESQIVFMGSGRGENLVIDGRSLSIPENATIAIKEGRYRSITIQHIKYEEGKPLRITNDGEVSISEAMFTKNIENVIIAGNGDADVTYGFKFHDIAYRAIVMEGTMDGVRLSHMSFRNVNDYVISRTDADNERYYDGTPRTRDERLKILSCKFENTGPIIFGGSLNGDHNDDSGFIKDVEIAHNEFSDTDWGTLVSFNNVQDYHIHHNSITDVNGSNNNHNGIFFMQGNGTFHDNKLVNYQGNALRAWVYSRGNEPATVKIFNNICYNSRKYSAFELQQFERNLVPGKSTFVNAQVYNNTVGKMNTSKDWEGQLLDLYHLSGELEYHDNLGFELYTSNRFSAIGDMINNMGDTKITVHNNNKYFDDPSDAVTDVFSFASKHAGIGTAVE